VPESSPALSIVIPTYNERDRLGMVVDATCAVLARAGVQGELVIVDDNSPDGTGAIAESLKDRYPVQVVHRSGKLGLGTAVIDGFAVATAPVVGVMDGDLSHPPELLPPMLAALDATGSDFVIGSRYVPGGGTEHWSFGREFLSRLACVLARAVVPVRDATSGFFLVRRDVVSGVQIGHGGFKVCLELLVRGHATAVVEVPYVFRGRELGQSKMNVIEATGYLQQLYDLWRFRRRSGRRQRYTVLDTAALERLAPRAT
jgi:dolichol-phosphate mannosyltransferase